MDKPKIIKVKRRMDKDLNILIKNMITKIYEHIQIFKPCKKLGYCPYGILVELFALKDLKIKGKKINCEVFGHHCPMFSLAEDL